MSTADFQIDVRLTPDQCCKYCASEKGKIIQAGPHRKLICGACNKYLKFVGEAEFQNIVRLNQYPSNMHDDLIENTGFDQAMGEINFKLDLIIDHLNIKERK
jgi:hypothetical protein